MRVFVVLFNARTENEGIHTISMDGRNKILMFESEDDATRFALMLEAQDLPPATVERVDDSEIKDFCQDADYDWDLVPDGALAIPPENNVSETDWQEKPKQAEISDLDRIRRQLEGLL